MIKKLFGIQKSNKGIILLYHRIFRPITDVWDLSVSPQNFEQHLKMLKDKFNVLTLNEMMDAARTNRIPKNSIAISFDDGYEDNFLEAKPLLEHYEVPATFFICTGNIGTNRQFWWDELETIFLQSRELPAFLPTDLDIYEKNIQPRLETDLDPKELENHQKWRPFITPTPTGRAEAFLLIWEKLRQMKSSEQSTTMKSLRTWAGTSETSVHPNRSMNVEQLRKLRCNPYIAIGAHSVSHPALAMHSRELQNQEIHESKRWLENELHQTVDWFAFPFGNHNSITLEIVREIGFRGSVTTENKVVGSHSSSYTLGRYVVPNWPSDQLANFLFKAFKN